MTILTIAPASPDAPLRFLQTMASLPESFSSTSRTAAPDAVSVDGGPNWAKQATTLIETGVKALVVSDPRVVEADEVHNLILIAEHHGATVELAESYAGDPALKHHGESISANLETMAVLIVTENHPLPDLRSAALSIVRTCRALGRPLELETVRWHGHSVFVIGRSQNLVVEGVVTRSNACVGQRIQGLGYASTMNVWLTGSATAQPADIAITTLSGETRFTTIYETADRAAWKRLHQTVTSSAQRNTHALTLFAQDLTSVLTAI